ncbi:MAG TPA: aminotransferase class I/II-fold pyridoxal phosphate-dependent enzyme, partial [Turneriella sp.]|nr:aminotransferase class I/II-fold pyridoxal phosphate-dependent enzyme [Turneriella sp.]
EAFIDRLAHASLVDGVRLSGAKKIYFRHNDLIHLEALLQKSKASRKMIITESLFSMDGDRAPLHELQELSQKYDALFYVDDAHALGLYG